MIFKPSAMARAAALALALALAGTASAQDVAEPAAPAQRVEVTGSRLLSPNAESAAPLQVMTAAEIAGAGVTNLQDLLQKSPVFGSPGISRSNSNFATSSAGVASVNLRNLGAARTLVLVNGRRFVSGVSGSATVDLNSIATELIERVEVLTGGASSAYGSDAVGGVVNLILKKNLRGLGLDAQLGQSGQGDDRLQRISATYGLGDNAGRDFLTAHLSYSRQGAVLSKDRQATAVDQASMTLAGTGGPADLLRAQRPFYSSFAPQGRFFYRAAGAADDSSFTFDAAGNPIPFSTNGPQGDGVGATGYNRSAHRTIAIPTDRLLLALNGEKSLGDTHALFVETHYAQTRTRTRAEPLPLDSTGSASPVYAGGGYVPAEFMIDGVMRRNPLVPQHLYERATDRDGDGARDYNFTRRMSDIALRTSAASRHTVRVLAGLRGELSPRWSYELYGAHASTQDHQTGTGQVNVVHMRHALEAIADVDDLNGNGNRSEAICRDAAARAAGCVPANIFGANTLSAAAAAYIAAPTSISARITQRLVGASASGEPLALPAGPVGVVLGTEYRHEASRDEADALTRLGLNAGNVRPDTVGSFDVKEVYGELRLPLLRQQPLARRLDGTLALRAGDYSTAGRTTSWNAGLDWALNPGLRLRLTRSTSTRAPDIGELYQGPSQTFPVGLVDPCVGVTATSTTAASARCRAAPGVMANIAANGSFRLNQTDLQSISGMNLGNPALQAETGRSLTLGLVLTPRDVPLLQGAAFTLDYFDIRVSDAINTPGRQYALDQCYRGDARFCRDITRRAVAVGGGSAGAIATIDQRQENTGGLGQRGVDLTGAWAGALGPGRLSARMAYTYLIRAYTQATPEAEVDTSHDELGSSRNRWTLNLNYELGRLALKTTTHFIGQAYLDNQFLASNGVAREFARVPRKTYLDLQLSYQWRKQQQFYAGVNNLLDTQAPPVITGLPGTVTGTETDASTYDAIGRRFYLGWRLWL